MVYICVHVCVYVCVCVCVWLGDDTIHTQVHTCIKSTSVFEVDHLIFVKRVNKHLILF